MKYLVYVGARFLLTFLCKASALAAKKTGLSPALSVLDFFIKKRGASVAKEAKFCMEKAKKWQSRAGKCLVAYQETKEAIAPESGTEKESGES